MTHYDYLLIDLNALFHRSKHAILKRTKEDLKTPDGKPITGSYGVLNTLISVIKEYGLFKYIVACYDAGGGSDSRKKINPDYKSNRKTQPDSFYEDYEILKQQILPSMGIQVLGIYGYEADDIIYTLSKRNVDKKGLILSVDKDLLGCIVNNTDVLIYSSNKKKTIWTKSLFKEKFGIDPRFYTLYKSIIGDNSDNIKGIKGYGPKKTSKLLNSGSSLAGIFNDVDYYTINKNKEILKLKELTTKLPFVEHHYNREHLLAVCEDLNFTSIIKRI